MPGGKWLIIIGWTFLCPGAGQGVAGRRLPALVWAAASLVVMLAIPLTVWAAHAALAIRIAAVVDAIVRVHRARPARLGRDAPALLATGAGVLGFAYSALVVEMFRVPSSSMYPTLQIDDRFYTERLSLLWSDPQRGDLIVFDQPCQPARQYIGRVMATGNDTIEIRCNVVHVNGAALPDVLVDAACEYEDRMEGETSWHKRSCSRYRETSGSRSYEVFHDRERPGRDALAKAGTLEHGDDKDFPRDDDLRNCGNLHPSEGGPSKAQQPGRIVVTKSDAKVCEPRMHFVVPPDSLFVLGDHRSNSNDSRYWGVVPAGNVVGRIVGVVWPAARIGGR